MRIIKEGKPLLEVPEHCDNCGCDFLFTEKDLTYTLDSAFPYRKYYHLNCPWCNDEINLSDENKYKLWPEAREADEEDRKRCIEHLDAIWD